MQQLICYLPQLQGLYLQITDVLDMITNLRVFDDDQQILECLMNDETFKGAIIDDE